MIFRIRPWSLAVGLALAAPLSAQTCPDWSSKFDQIQSPAMQQAVQNEKIQGWDNLFAQGGDIQSQIDQGEQLLTQVRASLASATQCAVMISTPGGRPTSAQCDNLGQTGGSAAEACMCQELISRDTILATEGVIELLKCRAGKTNPGIRTQAAQQLFKDFEDKLAQQGVLGDTAKSGDLPADVAQLASRGGAIEDECDAYQGAQYIDCSMGVQGYSTNDGNSFPAGDGDVNPSNTDGSKSSADAKDDGLDMLAHNGTLKPEFVNETSDYTAVGHLPQSACDAKVELTLLNATPSPPGGSTLHFGVNINDSHQPGSDAACVDVEYTVFATEHRNDTSGSGYSDGAGQTFHSKTLDTGPIDLPVNANGSNGTELVGWRIVGATCRYTKNCVKKLSPEQCQDLESFVNNELPNKMMAQIKQWGIKAQGQSMIQDIKSTLEAETSYAASDWADLAAKVKLLADTVTTAFDVLVPEKTAAEGATKITAQTVYTAVKNASGQFDFTKSLLEGDLTGILDLDFSVSGQRKRDIDETRHTLFSMIGIVQDMQTIQEGRDFRAELQSQLDKLQHQIDAYNADLVAIGANLKEMQAIRDGINEACSSPTTSTAPSN